MFKVVLLQIIVLENNNYTPWLKYLGLTAQLLILIALSVYAGIKLDDRLNISPLLTVVLPLLVLAATFYKLIKETSKKKNDNGADE